MDDALEDMVLQLANNQTKILDDFGKTYLASKTLSTWDIQAIVERLELVMTTEYSDGKVCTKYYFKLRDQHEN